jgi:hypothetical protein
VRRADSVVSTVRSKEKERGEKREEDKEQSSRETHLSVDASALLAKEEEEKNVEVEELHNDPSLPPAAALPVPPSGFMRFFSSSSSNNKKEKKEKKDKEKKKDDNKKKGKESKKKEQATVPVPVNVPSLTPIFPPLATTSAPLPAATNTTFVDTAATAMSGATGGATEEKVDPILSLKTAVRRTQDAIRIVKTDPSLLKRKSGGNGADPSLLISPLASSPGSNRSSHPHTSRSVAPDMVTYWEEVEVQAPRTQDQLRVMIKAFNHSGEEAGGNSRGFYIHGFQAMCQAEGILQAGDQILQIAGQSLEGLALKGVAGIIRGADGPFVHFKVKRSFTVQK